MSYRIAAVDVHKKMLAVVVVDVAGEGEYQFERRRLAPPLMKCTCRHSGWRGRRSKKQS